jgi:hypothetical protein
MGKAWPRFLPKPTPEAIAHALIIEASAIIIEQLAEGHADLIRAHERAEAHARAHYSDDDLRRAWNACATEPGNGNVLLHHLVRFWPAPAEGRQEARGVRPHRPATASAKRLPTQYRNIRRVNVSDVKITRHGRHSPVPASA